jgi:hypothetical protein
MQEQEQTQPPASSPRNCLLIILLIVVLAAALLYLLSHAGGSGGQSSSFDAAPYALQIAQRAYQVRRQRAPTGHDFGGGIIVVQYADGSAPGVITSPIYEGYDSPPPDVNATHSERRTQDDFVLPTFALLKSHGTVAQASEIDVILFTQFSPCLPCRAEMRAWQNQDRQAAGTAKVFLTVWTLSTTFNPLSHNPRQRTQPSITGEEDIQEVPIPFDAPPASATALDGALTVEREFSYNDAMIIRSTLRKAGKDDA